ncbi:MAG: sensor histidine kinase [Alsobacter sp.]
MFCVILSRFARTATFRLALVYAVIFGISSLLLFGFLYWRISVYGLEQLRGAIDLEMSVLIEEGRRSGIERLREEVDRLGGSAESRSNYYLLQDPGGRAVAGNLPGMTPRSGLFEFTIVSPATTTIRSGSGGLSLFRGSVLADGHFLAIGRTLSELDDLNRLVLRALLAAVLVTAVLALSGGLLLGRGVLHRIDTIAQTSAQIVDGQMDVRVPVLGTGDELDRLASNLNLMLDRIQQLMEGVRQVSNDIAHDLRTPLARLRQRLERLSLGGTGTAGREELEAALAEIDGILATFSALLRIAQIESGSRRSGFRTVDLSELFGRLAEAYAPVAEDRGQQFSAALEPGVTHTGDRELLTQMVANLVENAIRHAPEGAAVAMRLRRGEGGRPEAEIADNGPGIPKAETANVFRRFYRLERNRTTTGNGLGLPLVAAVAELHGIRLELGDNHPGLIMTLRF